ncbi:MAG: ACT domain-containing protein [Actinomycetota bacterium]|nr:ACT domain-containing protein [Actinomycetota bacterium]
MSTPGGHGGTELAQLLRAMDPVLHDAVHVVVTGPHDLDTRPLQPFATVTEHEGTTAIIDVERLADAVALGCTPDDPPPMSLITLRVHSSLLAVGLTAAVATALASRGISCNVVAGYFHDHLLVPADRGSDALDVLRALRDDGRP